MLIRFIVENFLSFKDAIELRMSAGNSFIHGSHIIKEKGHNFLKGTFLFGPNASGKSNLIKAVAFACDIVIDGIQKVNCEKKYFRINEQYKFRPGVFQFEISSGGYFYNYGFAISYIDKIILEEWLYRIDDNFCVFERTRQDNGNFSVKSDIAKQSRFDIYLQDFASSKMRHTLFLYDVAMRSPDDEEEYKPFRDVMKWFKNMIIIFPESRYGGILQMMGDKDKRINIERLMKYFDTGINSIKKDKREFDEAFSDVVEREVLKSRIDTRKLAGDHTALLISHGNNRLMEISYKNGTLYAAEVMTDHGNNKELFSFQDESDGTCRLFDLLPLYQIGKQSRVILIDEIDRSLHPKAVKEFIRYFYEVTKNVPSQLIATTHDLNLMDLDFLRQDEIWFVVRENDNRSTLYSLNKFKHSFGGNAAKDYMLGRFGALPFFSKNIFDKEN